MCSESLSLGVCCCRTHGAFGVSWLGKAYFICSVVISLLVAWWWDLFCEKSTSRYLLALFFRWVPMAILWHSTSCKDLATVMVLVALNSDALSQWLLTVWITAEASRQTPSYEHSGQEVCALTPIMSKRISEVPLTPILSQTLSVHCTICGHFCISLSMYEQLINADEFRLQGQMHTQAALADLRQYLSTPEGKATMYRVSDRQVAAELLVACF